MAEAEGRVEPRTKALIRVRLRGSGQERDACILDASSRGLLLTTADPPQRGDFVELLAGSNSLVGHVKWAGSRRFGIVLRERIDVISLLQGDSGPVTRSALTARPGKRPAAAIALDSRNQSHAFQFMLVIGLVVAVVLFLATTLGKGVGQLFDQATNALAASGPSGK